MITWICLGFILLLLEVGFVGCVSPKYSTSKSDAIIGLEQHVRYDIEKPDEEWRTLLSREQYRILRERKTEMPFINKYYKQKKHGIYHCAACDNPVFRSEDKFHSGTGWPGFSRPYSDHHIRHVRDNRYKLDRIEVVCAQCGSHLGYLLEDGPQPSGRHYRVNSTALGFQKTPAGQLSNSL